MYHVLSQRNQFYLKFSFLIEKLRKILRQLEINATSLDKFLLSASFESQETRKMLLLIIDLPNVSLSYLFSV